MINVYFTKIHHLNSVTDSVVGYRSKFNTLVQTQVGLKGGFGIFFA